VTGHVEAAVGAVGLQDGDQQLDPALVLLAFRAWSSVFSDDVEPVCEPVEHRAHGLGEHLHGHQVPPHVGVLARIGTRAAFGSLKFFTSEPC
jgi:hypothetical protein